MRYRASPRWTGRTRSWYPRNGSPPVDDRINVVCGLTVTRADQRGGSRLLKERSRSCVGPMWDVELHTSPVRGSPRSPAEWREPRNEAEACDRLLHALVTRTVRAIPTEVPLGAAVGLPVACAATFDNLQPIRRSFLTERVGVLSRPRAAICEAFRALADC